MQVCFFGGGRGGICTGRGGGPSVQLPASAKWVQKLGRQEPNSLTARFHLTRREFGGILKPLMLFQCDVWSILWNLFQHSGIGHTSFFCVAKERIRLPQPRLSSKNTRRPPPPERAEHPYPTNSNKKPAYERARPPPFICGYCSARRNNRNGQDRALAAGAGDGPSGNVPRKAQDTPSGAGRLRRLVPAHGPGNGSRRQFISRSAGSATLRRRSPPAS